MAVYINTLNGGSITIGSSGGSPAPAGHADTWYKYANDSDWRTVSISGTISGGEDEETGDFIPTTQIPDVTNIVALEIGTDVTSIGRDAFTGCSNLTGITIPNSVTSIGNSAFHECRHLTSVTIPNSVTSIGQAAFSWSGLTNITIPNSITSIGGSMFNECPLTTVTIPDSVTSIGDYAFELCTSLTSVTIPDGVTSIGDSAFRVCDQLTIVTIVATGKPGASAANVKQMMISAGVSSSITWNMPS